MVVWYIFPVLVCCTKKNLATLDSRILKIGHCDCWPEAFFAVPEFAVKRIEFCRQIADKKILTVWCVP
jgi:hypothetical protein